MSWISSPRTVTMRTIRRACGLIAALLFSLAGTSCREPAAPPASVASHRPARRSRSSSVLPDGIRRAGDTRCDPRECDSSGCRARRRSVAVVDTVVPFRETDADRRAHARRRRHDGERALRPRADSADRRPAAGRRIVARDTVVAYTTGQAPTPTSPVVLRYVGPDTAVARIALASHDTRFR